MPRPVPHSSYLTRLAQRVRTVFGGELALPTLLHAHFGTVLAVLADEVGNCLYAVEVKPARILHRLPLPPAIGRARDLRAFTVSPDMKLLAAQDRVSKQFVVWSLEDGEIRNVVDGDGVIPPALTFLTPEHVAVCDGPRLSVHSVGSRLLHFTELPEGLRSVALHVPRGSAPGTVIAVGVFQWGHGSHQFRSLRLENGHVVLDREGPYRPRPESPGVVSHVFIHELLTVPGSTRELLVALEEEENRHVDVDHHNAVVRQYMTRLLAIDPLSGNYLPGEAEIPGRQCMERRGSGLHLVDEHGRRRQVTGPPMDVHSIDWRLAG